MKIHYFLLISFVLFTSGSVFSMHYIPEKTRQEYEKNDLKRLRQQEPLQKIDPNSNYDKDFMHALFEFHSEELFKQENQK